MSKIVFDSDNCQKLSKTHFCGQVCIIVILSDENIQNIVLFLRVTKLIKHAVRGRNTLDPSITRNIRLICCRFKFQNKQRSKH